VLTWYSNDCAECGPRDDLEFAQGCDKLLLMLCRLHRMPICMTQTLIEKSDCSETIFIALPMASAQILSTKLDAGQSTSYLMIAGCLRALGA
jgi:hypothetical protein